MDRHATNVADRLNIESVKELKDDRNIDERVRKSDSCHIISSLTDRPQM